MRVLLSSVGSRGDLQPMLALGLGLRRAGHEPLIAAPPGFRTWIEQHGLRFHPVGFDIYQWSQLEPDLARSPLHAARRMTEKIQSEVSAQFRDLKDVVPEFDCLVNTGVNTAASSVAEKHRVPYLFAAFVPGMVPSSAHPPPILPWPAMPRVLNRVAWEGLEILYRTAIGNRIDLERQAIGLPKAGRFSDLFMGSEILIATDPELSGRPQRPKVPFTQTGFWAYRSDDSLPEDLERFIAAGPPPWYLGFGSVPDHSPAETTRLFVDVMQTFGARAIVSRGWANLARQPLPEGFFATSDVPHEQLFPRMAGVIHHGGSGTTHTSARAGVPQILVPHGADQFFWGRQIEKLGVGPEAIHKSRFSRERLIAAIRWTEENRDGRARAKALGERLRAVDGVGNAIEHLERRFGVSRRAASA
jgi:UDP:flavonoid glycosyltransferase YjiC (YdhE family)